MYKVLALARSVGSTIVYGAYCFCVNKSRYAGTAAAISCLLAYDCSRLILVTANSHGTQCQIPDFTSMESSWEAWWLAPIPGFDNDRRKASKDGNPPGPRTLRDKVMHTDLVERKLFDTA